MTLLYVSRINHAPTNPPPTGFSHAGVPRVSTDLITLILPQLPALLIISVIEHIAIAKSLGRLSSYKVCPSQEILSQGASNLLAPFVGGYPGTGGGGAPGGGCQAGGGGPPGGGCLALVGGDPGTGAFGASGVLSKTGVRTPLAGLFSAMVLVLALYVLTGVFFFIPKAALAALIIHAVSNLLAEPSAVARYARLSPLELLIWITGIVLAFFKGLEVSMYVTIALSAVLLLVRMSRTRGRFMGAVKVHDIRAAEDSGCGNCRGGYDSTEDDLRMVDCCLSSGPRQVYVPLDRRDGSNPLIEVNEVHPGVIVYRFPEGLNYTNCAHHIEDLEAYIVRNTSRTTEDKPEHPSVSPLSYPHLYSRY